MFESAAKAYDGDILALVLTGMGHDGRDGARKIVDTGGTLIAQDAETSVVWGMPGAVAEAGLASEILPLDDIAARVMELCRS
jgi:two-component system chemotaxis response regulator CheB